ncbi:hypothetical protein K7I13_07490 [Brucepastera parasyntrophica]|uniref:hypothetical protein n=1 Tax=Brucepastera parasyntrophica TaxID=2880008 RepID=UPI00210ADD0A|nr:hypothetical protein [Brucepastera parasyntrophica]ULQ61086.1 hypothetical protein K7I13_07490 [Brucepastera parasyntrophica]
MSGRIIASLLEAIFPFWYDRFITTPSMEFLRTFSGVLSGSGRLRLYPYAPGQSSLSGGEAERLQAISVWKTPTCIRVIPAEGEMKTRLVSFFCVFLFVSLGAVFAGGKSDKAADLVIYAYDSWVADWGPGPEIVRLFEAETGYKVSLISCGDAAQVLSRAVLERKNPGSDILIGIDNNQEETARRAGVLRAYKPANAALVADELVMADDWLVTPMTGDFLL